MGSIRFRSAWNSAVNKAVKPVTSNSPAPPINSPNGLVDSPEVGNDTEGRARKKQGKSRLKIATSGDATTASRGTGLNI